MRTGLFGGSFDPIHHGHIRPIREARQALRLDRVVYLPTGRPPHKPERHGQGTGEGALAAAHQRFAMVELALLAEEGLFVSDHELSEARTSYTVDTLEYFRRRDPEGELVLLIGADSWQQLETWRDWPRLLELAEVGVLVRPGWEDAPVDEMAEERRAAVESGRVHFVHNTPLPLSSRRIRARLAAGAELSPDEMPQLVLDYVAKYDLYRR